MFRGDHHGPPTYQCGNRRLAIHANVRVDVVVAVKRLDRCPITLGGAG
jgi:hypothetical protein